MSDDNKQLINKLPKERISLYDLVWTEPAEKVASRYGVTIEYLAKQCSELQIPRPMAGYWRALAKGNAPKAPILPALKKKEITLSKNKNEIISRSSDINIKNKHPSSSFKKKDSKQIENKTYDKNWLNLVNDLKYFIPAAKITKEGYYKPTKKKLLDLNVSDTGFDNALIFLTKLFIALDKKGYRVLLAKNSEGLLRADIDVNEEPKTSGFFWDRLWRPYTPSVIFLKGIYVGFSLAEMTEYVPAKDIKGRYVRDEKMINWTKGKNACSFGYVSKHSLPTGRFLLNFYSPYKSTIWKVQFRQTRQCGLVSQIPKIVEALDKAVPIINKQLAEESQRVEQQRIQYEIDRAKYAEQERIRKFHEAHKKSLIELRSIMTQWTEEKRIEQFLQEVAYDAENLDNDQKEKVMERIELAKKFLNANSAIELLINWKSPWEIF